MLELLPIALGVLAILALVVPLVAATYWRRARDRRRSRAAYYGAVPASRPPERSIVDLALEECQRAQVRVDTLRCAVNAEERRLETIKAFVAAYRDFEARVEQAGAGRTAAAPQGRRIDPGSDGSETASGARYHFGSTEPITAPPEQRERRVAGRKS